MYLVRGQKSRNSWRKASVRSPPWPNLRSVNAFSLTPAERRLNPCRSRSKQNQQLRQQMEEMQNSQSKLMDKLIACCKEVGIIDELWVHQRETDATPSTLQPTGERTQRLFSFLREELERRGTKLPPEEEIEDGEDGAGADVDVVEMSRGGSGASSPAQQLPSRSSPFSEERLQTALEMADGAVSPAAVSV